MAGRQDQPEMGARLGLQPLPWGPLCPAPPPLPRFLPHTPLPALHTLTPPTPIQQNLKKKQQPRAPRVTWKIPARGSRFFRPGSPPQRHSRALEAGRPSTGESRCGPGGTVLGSVSQPPCPDSPPLLVSPGVRACSCTAVLAVRVPLVLTAERLWPGRPLGWEPPRLSLSFRGPFPKHCWGRVTGAKWPCVPARSRVLAGTSSLRARPLGGGDSKRLVPREGPWSVGRAQCQCMLRGGRLLSCSDPAQRAGSRSQGSAFQEALLDGAHLGLLMRHPSGFLMATPGHPLPAAPKSAGPEPI